MKRVLIIGSEGQLGMCIQKIHKEFKDVHFVFTKKNELDITKKDSVDDFFGKQAFDFCINCAAYTKVDQAEKEPKKAFMVNAEGVKNIATACKENNVTLIHISTDYVFDGEKRTPYTVEDIPNPINVYGKSKLKGEQYIQEILESYFIIRTSWLYSEFGNNFYKAILEKAKTEKTIYVTDDQIGCPTNTNNLAEFIIKAINTDDIENRVYHFCDGKSITWYDFAKEILEENNLKNKVNLVKATNYVTFAKRPKNSVLSNK
ncbi:dTDP-4-dehydrorhamnose reductase [Leptobacterium sp. I13]|uniref:dTDP-4-dehydrorhamnose reductase n=1 Tax=Leptobacterium meishanense TaxID=3128904 RepID=UPI0030EBC4F4